MPRLIPVRFLAAAAALLCAGAAAGCTTLPATLVAAGPWNAPGGDPLAAATRVPPSVSVLTSTAPDALTATFAGELFTSAPVVVVAGIGSAALRTAEKDALAAHAPLLVSANTPGTALLAEIKDLHPKAVLAVGVSPATLSARLHGTRVITRAALLPPKS